MKDIDENSMNFSRKVHRRIAVNILQAGMFKRNLILLFCWVVDFVMTSYYWLPAIHIAACFLAWMNGYEFDRITDFIAAEHIYTSLIIYVVFKALTGFRHFIRANYLAWVARLDTPACRK